MASTFRKKIRPLCCSAVLAMLAGCGSSGGGSEYPKDERAAWLLVSSDRASDTIKIRSEMGDCSSFVRTDVRETSTKVEIAVIVRTTSRDCTDGLKYEKITVQLDNPLADRVIVSA